LDLSRPAFAGLQHDAAGVTAAELLHNCHIKLYPDGATVKVASAPIFREAGWEGPDDQKSHKWDFEEEGSGPKPDNLARARRRARAAIVDYCRCTEMRWFCTLTLDPKKIDRYDRDRTIKAATTWLTNQVQRRGLAYVVVPELHEDGAVHFHGMLNDALEMVDSGTIKLPGVKKPRRPRSAAQRAEWLDNGGRVVYNIPAWRWGYTTATELETDRYRAAVGYVAKYIGKGSEKIAGRWYYHGGRLGRPAVLCADVDWTKAAAAAEGHIYDLDALGVTAATLDLSLEEVQGVLDSLQ
jgi:hypothetical protein